MAGYFFFFFNYIQSFYYSSQMKLLRKECYLFVQFRGEVKEEFMLKVFFQIKKKLNVVNYHKYIIRIVGVYIRFEMFFCFFFKNSFPVADIYNYNIVGASGEHMTTPSFCVSEFTRWSFADSRVYIWGWEWYMFVYLVLL